MIVIEVWENPGQAAPTKTGLSGGVTAVSGFPQ